MTVGTVKWFNPSKGYGFIEPTDGSKDVFIHISALERAGIGSLNEGQKIEYELGPGNTGKSSGREASVSSIVLSAVPANSAHIFSTTAAGRPFFSAVCVKCRGRIVSMT